MLQELGDGSKRVGIDASTVSVATWRSLQKALKPHVLTATAACPVQAVWEEEGRDFMPTGKIVEHPIEFAGVSVSDKLASLRETLKKQKASAYVVSSLDEVRAC